MIGAIIGDIVGSRFEFNNATGPNWQLFTKECDYTDDTICTCAIADAALQKKDYGETLHEWCRRYPHPTGGYGGAFSVWVHSDYPRPYYSFGNGAAMRVSPVGWLFDSVGDVLEEAAKTARVTHDHPEGIAGAKVTALAVWMLRNRCGKEQVRNFIENVYPGQIPPYKPYSNPFSEACRPTVLTAFSCFLASNSFEDAIRKAVLVGGDSDTIAAIAGAFAEAYYGVPGEIADAAMSFLPDEMKKVVRDFYSNCKTKAL